MSGYQKTKYPGVEYRENPQRRHGTRPDRYFSIRYYRQRKQVRECLGWGSEGWNAAKAQRILSDIKANIKLGTGPQSLKAMRTAKAAEEAAQQAEAERQKTFAQAAQIYIEEYSRPSKASAGHEAARLRDHLNPLIGNIPLQALTSYDVDQAKQAIQTKGLAASTVKQCLALVRQIINYATRRGWFQGENPCKGITWPKINNQRVRYLSEAEEEEFFTAAKSYSPFVHDVCLVSLYSGLRMGEIFGLQAMDIDLLAKRILVRGLNPERGPKSGYNRIVPLHEKLKPLFEARLLDRAPDALLFPSHNGGQRLGIGTAFYTIIKRLGWNEGITDRRLRLVPHSFRHTFASRLVDKGKRVPVIQKLLGHSTIQMTMRYVHVDDDQCKDAIADL